MPVDRVLPAPSRPPTTFFPGYAGPGFAEIKAHNVDGIKGGLAQLLVTKKELEQAFQTMIKAKDPKARRPGTAGPHHLLLRAVARQWREQGQSLGSGTRPHSTRPDRRRARRAPGSTA